MREIKFRGKRKDNGEWVYGDVHFNADCSKCHLHKRGERVHISYTVIPETVGQYTGRHDKNGKEYYVGSIVRGLKCKYNDDSCTGVVYYNKHHAAYWVSDDKTFNMPLGNANWWEVIGNIHDPELLEEK